MSQDPFLAKSFVQVADGIFSRAFDGHRVDVRIPSIQSEQPPVLVMQDGMNVFFPEFSSTGQTWGVLEAIDRGEISAEILVIAVWGEGGAKKFNPRRINEFLCDDIFADDPALWETINPSLKPPTREARGNYLLGLISDEVLPTTLREFGFQHSARKTALVGCSVAGVHAIYSAAKRPDSFGAALGFSSHWEFGGRKLIRQLAESFRNHPKPMIWSDSGTMGLDVESERLNRFAELEFMGVGFEPGLNLNVETFHETGHSEVYWSKRFPSAVDWWSRGIMHA